MEPNVFDKVHEVDLKKTMEQSLRAYAEDDGGSPFRKNHDVDLTVKSAHEYYHSKAALARAVARLKTRRE